METRYAKRKKHLCYKSDEVPAVDDGNGEDRISDLPNEIVHRIFSFLRLEHVAITCVLSKRWKCLWYSYPCLDFSTTFDSIFKRDRRIWGVDFAYQKQYDHIDDVLSSLDRHWDVRILKFRGLMDVSAIVRSMRLAVKHNVQELDLDFSTEDGFNLPRCVMNSLSLRDLRLTSSGDARLRVPPLDATKCCFKSLQSLYLVGVDFRYHPSHLNLFSDSLFPSLAKLDLKACSGLQHLRIRMSGLKDLCLAMYIEELDISAKNLEKLSVRKCFVVRVAIDAPLLEVIIWIDDVTGQFDIGKCRSLKEATVNLHPFDEDLSDLQLHGLSNLLNGISPCRSLTVDVSVFEILSRSSNRQRCVFERLTSLEVILSHGESESQLWYEDIIEWDEDIIEWESQAESLDFLLHHLKVVKIVGFEEYSNDVGLVKLFLNHAKVLEQLLLEEYKHSPLGEDTKSEIMEFTRASSDAHIIFKMKKRKA